MRLVGLTLAHTGVLVGGAPVNGDAQRLRVRLGEALAAREVDGHEAAMVRDTWHAALINFTGAPAVTERGETGSSSIALDTPCR